MTGKMGLFFDEELQRLIDSFAYCFNVKITVFSSRMEELIVGLQNPGSQFCRLVKKKLRLRYRCCRQDRLMCKRCEQKDDLLIYHCYAGPSEAVLPIKIDDTLAGYGVLGQFRTSKGLSKEIMEEWGKAGFEPEIMQKAFEKQPFFDKSALDNMLRLFSMLIAFAVNREYVRFRHPGLAEQVSHWLDEHIAEPLTLDDLVAAVNRSKSTVSHTVKRQLGISVKQLCILKRIERFESIVTSDPAISIQEAASLIGYQDPFYFSRIYKKVRFSAPSAYINSMRNQGLKTESIAHGV
jgi:AraC-like DNA-binding protein